MAAEGKLSDERARYFADDSGASVLEVNRRYMEVQSVSLLR
jgi:hypothetical protein